jgi:hypothetical protein
MFRFLSCLSAIIFFSLSSAQNPASSYSKSPQHFKQTTNLFVTHPTKQNSALRLYRTVSQDSLLPCQTTLVTLRIQNQGNTNEDYALQEMIPPGYLPLAENSPLSGNTFFWRGSLGAGEQVVYSYQLKMTPSAEALETIQGHLKTDQGQGFFVSLGSLYRYSVCQTTGD